MPIYQYAPTTEQHCPVCRDGFELLEKISDTALDQCPACKAPIRRLISAPSVASNPNTNPDNLDKKRPIRKNRRQRAAVFGLRLELISQYRAWPTISGPSHDAGGRAA